MQPQTLVTPGPGVYKPERSLTILAKKNESSIKRSSSMFISQVRRQPYQQAKHVVEQPVVQYDSKTNTIGEVVRQKVEAGLGNPLLANLKAKRQADDKNSTLFGFNSNAERFPSKHIPESETYLGPGYYDVQASMDKRSQPAQSSTVPGVNVTLPPRSQTFLSQAQRFGDDKNRAVVPGPGHYSNEDMNTWFKRSYNMIFTE